MKRIGHLVAGCVFAVAAIVCSMVGLRAASAVCLVLAIGFLVADELWGRE